MRMLSDIFKATSRSIFPPWRLFAFFVFTALIFILLVLVPVWTTPGNDFLFQISITPPFILFLMVVLSLGNSLLLLMQYHIRKDGHVTDPHTKAKEGITLFGIIFSSLAATVACAACYSSILALLSLGVSAFIVEHRFWFAALALAIMLVALHYSARKIVHGCKVCQATFTK